MVSFKSQHSLEKRTQISTKIRREHPDRVPIILERAPGKNTPPTSKTKYLAPQVITIGKFSHEIRRHIQLDSNEALYLFVGGSNLVPSNITMNELYQRYRDEDGFLYIKYGCEATFGSN